MTARLIDAAISSLYIGQNVTKSEGSLNEKKIYIRIFWVHTPGRHPIGY